MHGKCSLESPLGMEFNTSKRSKKRFANVSLIKFVESRKFTFSLRRE